MRDSSRRVKTLLILLYVAAAILIGRAAVEQNVSPFPLESFAAGTGPMPYQARYLMVPVLRWASHARVAAKVTGLLHNSVRGPMEFVLQAVNSLCLILAGWLTVRVCGQFTPRTMLDWLPPWILLWIVAITYVVRYDQRLFLPYDFLSLLLFNIGLLACLEARAGLFLAMMLIGTYNRETTLFLIPVWVAVQYTKRPGRSLVVAAGALAVWIGVKLHLRMLVHGASPGLEFNWNWNLAAILLPHHWPQLLSIGGYLAIPMWLGRRLVTDPRLRLAWVGMIPFLLGTLIFGVWNETRIFGELSILFAVTAAIQFEEQLRQAGHVSARLEEPEDERAAA